MHADATYNFLAASLEIYSLTARRSGRTNAMLAAVKPGDCIITFQDRERPRLDRLLRRRGIEGVTIIIANMERPLTGLNSIGRRFNAIHFDHAWAERYFRDALRHAQQQLRDFQQYHTTEPPIPQRSDPALSDWILSRRHHQAD